jgi:uncharacterized protein YqeY
MSVLEQVQDDVRTAMRAGERERVGALRMVANALQQDAKAGNDDEIAVLRRERKRRLEAADAYRSAGREDRAEAEEREATLIDAYLPTQLSGAELSAIVDDVVAEVGGGDPSDIGKVMGLVMPKVGGRADGRRVSEAVRARLARGGGVN